MVVELGDQVQAWATYPGGQSGNPSSRWYADRIPQWVAGELVSVHLPRTPSDLADSLRVARIVFSTGGAR
jgi:penicillin amidase